MRASQINGCAYCLDMHSKDARAEWRNRTAPVWAERLARDAVLHSERTSGARVDRIVHAGGETHVPDEVYEAVKKEFTEAEIVDLTYAVAAINSWNRLAIATRAVPGEHQPAQRLRRDEPTHAQPQQRCGSRMRFGKEGNDAVGRSETWCQMERGARLENTASAL